MNRIYRSRVGSEAADRPPIARLISMGAGLGGRMAGRVLRGRVDDGRAKGGWDRDDILIRGR